MMDEGWSSLMEEQVVCIVNAARNFPKDADGMIIVVTLARHADLWVGTVSRTYSPNSRILSSSQPRTLRYISFLSRLNAKMGYE
jgi:hypothetical protein